MRLEISELHKKLQTTMVYVTHDQIEAMTMGDRIVVLQDGSIEQVGTPLELYNTPKNIFVAGFIGSPKMNFITGNFAQRHKAHTVGIRPEDLTITKDPSDWVGTVQVAEHLGSDTYIHVIIDTIGKINVRASGHIPVYTGDTVYIGITHQNIHKFDGQGGRI